MVAFIPSLIFESNRNSTIISKHYIYNKSIKLVETCFKSLCVVKYKCFM